MIFVLSSMVIPTGGIIYKNNKTKQLNDIKTSDIINPINEINLTKSEFPKQSINPSTEIIYTKNITLSYSASFITNITVINPEVLIYNFTSLANRSLEQIILKKSDLTFKKTFPTTWNLNSTVAIGELPIMQSPTIIQFNLSVIDSPLIFPINFSITISKRSMIAIAQSGNYYANTTYPGQIDLFKIGPVATERQIALDFRGLGNSSWDLKLYNESGYEISSGPQPHFNATANESYYYSVDSSFNASYNILTRLEKKVYNITLGENTTIIEGPLLYTDDNYSFQFNLAKNQQIRFIENGSRQEWFFTNLNTNQMLIQNWHLTLKPINYWEFTWDSTTMSQIIEENGTYRIDIVQHTGNQFRIKISVHNVIMDLFKAQTYHGEILGSQDYETWFVNLTAGDEISINSTGNNFSLNLYRINNQYSFNVLKGIIGTPINYLVEYNGTYRLLVASSGYLGPYDLIISVKIPANRNNGISMFDILIVSAFIVICLVILYFVYKKTFNRKF